jgi:hypothetical protein
VTPQYPSIAFPPRTALLFPALSHPGDEHVHQLGVIVNGALAVCAGGDLSLDPARGGLGYRLKYISLPDAIEARQLQCQQGTGPARSDYAPIATSPKSSQSSRSKRVIRPRHQNIDEIFALLPVIVQETKRRPDRL